MKFYKTNANIYLNGKLYKQTKREREESNIVLSDLAYREERVFQESSLAWLREVGEANPDKKGTQEHYDREKKRLNDLRMARKERSK